MVNTDRLTVDRLVALLLLAAVVAGPLELVVGPALPYAVDPRNPLLRCLLILAACLFASAWQTGASGRRSRCRQGMCMVS